MPDYRRAEALNWACVCQKFGVPYDMPECVHVADRTMLHVEKRVLLKNWDVAPYGGPEPAVLPGDIHIQYWRPEFAENVFLETLKTLLMLREHPSLVAEKGGDRRDGSSNTGVPVLPVL